MDSKNSRARGAQSSAGSAKSGTFVDMNFKVTTAFRKLFKTEAVMHDISGKRLLEESFAAWHTVNGRVPPKLLR